MAKKILVVLGIIFVCLLVAGTVGVVTINYLGTKLDEQSKQYVDGVIPVIVSDWDPSQVIARASPELLEVAPPEKIAEFFRMFSDRLGRFKEYRGSKGEANISLHIPRGIIITALYSADVLFEKATAKVNFRVVRRDNDWQILEFRINSEALLN